MGTQMINLAPHRRDAMNIDKYFDSLNKYTLECETVKYRGFLVIEGLSGEPSRCSVAALMTDYRLMLVKYQLTETRMAFNEALCVSLSRILKICLKRPKLSGSPSPVCIHLVTRDENKYVLFREDHQTTADNLLELFLHMSLRLRDPVDRCFCWKPKSSAAYLQSQFGVILSTSGVVAPTPLPFTIGHRLDLLNEYRRMGIANEAWAIHHGLNGSFEMSPTYPVDLIIPKAFPVEMLGKVIKFRSSGRFPVLSYYHKSNRASITRSSQPAVSLFHNRCAADELLIQTIRETGDPDKGLLILDARPRAAAVANMARGYGFEHCEDYKSARLVFGNIRNIHGVRKAHVQLLRCLRGLRGGAEMTQLPCDAVPWVDFQSRILEAAITVARHVDRGTSVLVHCSDGWDRTPQITSLAQMLLDPYYRTLRGFLVLIEKEWVSFGHPFLRRHTITIGHGNETAPIFRQFLECVWQIRRQRPEAFGFSEHLLLLLAEASQDTYFGNFVANTYSERVRRGIPRKTLSVYKLLTDSRVEEVLSVEEGPRGDQSAAAAETRPPPEPQDQSRRPEGTTSQPPKRFPSLLDIKTEIKDLGLWTHAHAEPRARVAIIQERFRKFRHDIDLGYLRI